MAFPVITVQIAFANNPFTPLAGLTWTDVSHYVTGPVKTTQGRTHETAHIETGTMSLRLWNADDRFNPYNTSSPHYGPFTDGNLLTLNEASLESGATTGWIAQSNCTLTSSTTQALDGTHSLAVTSAAAGQVFANTPLGTSAVPIVAGATYTAMAWVRAATVTNGINLGMAYYDAGGGYLGTNFGAVVTDSTTGWAQITSTLAVPPVGSAFIAVQVAYSAGAAGEVHYFDQLGLFRGTPTAWSSPALTDTGVLGLVVGKRIRIRATWSGTVYDVWHGFIDTWAMGWPTEALNYVDITASDAYKPLNMVPVRGTYSSVVVADGATNYWRLGEPTPTQGTVAVDAVAGFGSHGNYTETCAGATGAILCDPNAAVDFGAYLGYVELPVTSLAALPYSIEAWVQLHGTPGGNDLVFIQSNNNHVSYTGIQVQPNAIVFYSNNAASGHTFVLTSAPVALPTDNKWHHLVATCSSSAQVLYLDGVAIALSTVATVTPVAGPAAIAGQASTVQAGVPSLNGAVDEVAVYNGTILSGAQVQNHYLLGFGFLAEKSGARVNDLLTAAGWPVADRSIATGLSTIAQPASTLAGSSCLAHILDVTDTENGVCYPAANGTMVFHDRTWPVTNATSMTSQLTVGETGEPFELAGTLIGTDDQDLWNDVVVQRVGGLPQEAVDLVSQSRYRVRTLSRSNVLHTNDNEPLAQAQYLLGQYSVPRLRVGSIVVNPISDPATLFPKVLTLSIQDRVTVARVSGSGPNFSQDSLIEHIAHDIDVKGAGWHTTWSLNAADTGRYWILGDATYGVLDSTTRLYY